MRRRIGLCLTAVLLLNLTGCTPAEPSTAQTAEPVNPLITLRVAQRDRDPLAAQLTDELITAFQQAQPDYRVEKVTFPSGPAGLDAMQAAMRNGELDVVPVHPMEMKQLSLSLQLLDPYLHKGFDPAPLGALLEQFRYHGELYSLPYAVHPVLLFANMQMLAEAGVTMEAGGWTWEQFREAVRRLTRGEEAARVWGLETQHPQYLARAYVEERAGKPVWLAEPEVIAEALRFFRGLVFDDQSLDKDKPQDWANMRIGTSRQILGALRDGKTAITLEPFADIGIRPPHGVTWDVMPFPSVSGRRPVLPMADRSLGIPRNSPQPEAAWAFLRFAAGPEGAVTLARLGTLPVFRSEAVQTAWTSRQPPLPPGAATVWAADWTRSEQFTGTYESDMLRAFHRAVNTTLSGVATVDQAMAQYQRDQTENARIHRR